LVGGALQVAGGVGVSTTGVGAVVGVVAVLHGADDFQAGARQLWTGEETESLTYKGVKATVRATGASEATASKIATGADIGLSFVGGVGGGAKVFSSGTKVAKEVEAVEKGFSTFNDFKKAYGPAGSGNAWHHIVEQNADNIAKFGAEKIHNLENLMKLEHGAGSIHAKISGYYSSKQLFTGGQTVRKWLSTKSFKEQYDFGIKILKQFSEK
jgi:hypothetical protein